MEGDSLPKGWGVGPGSELSWAELAQGLQQAWSPFPQITGTTEQGPETGFRKVGSDTWKAEGLLAPWVGDIRLG